jgi:GT2 family glycosyltransferase
VVIVNYRTAGLTVDCLRSLVGEREEMGERLSVVVTDNLSPDDSVGKIRAAVEENGWGSWVRVMPLGRNGGFAYGNNEAVRELLKGDVDYVHLLNPDTVAHPGAVRELVEFMDRNPRVGITGSRLEYPDGRVQVSRFRFHSVLGEVNDGLKLGVVTRALSEYVVAPESPAGAARADWVSGASFLVRTGVFREIGLLDERYFMYYEETDFCLRASRAGWECWYVPASRVIHLQGQATGGPGGKRVPAYFFDSRRWYFVKNHGRARAALADAAYAVSFAVWRARRWVQRKPDTDPPHMLGDFVRNSVFVKGFKLV